MDRTLAMQTNSGQQPDASLAVRSTRAAEAASVLRFDGVSKTYIHSAARMLLRRSLLSWLKRAKPDLIWAATG